jgi:hypothetical protein
MAFVSSFEPQTSICIATCLHEIGKFHLILKQPKRQLLCWKEGQLGLVQVVLFSTVYVRPMPGD